MQQTLIKTINGAIQGKILIPMSNKPIAFMYHLKHYRDRIDAIKFSEEQKECQQERGGR